MVNKVYIVICEGKSEEQYLQQLNRCLKERDIALRFIPQPVGNGHYKPVTKKYKKEKKNNPRDKFLIWVDKDIYQRNDCNDLDLYNNKPSGIPDFLFNCHNYEDMLSMHLDDELFSKWLSTCSSNNHFSCPMHSCTYEPLFCQEICEAYKKGEFPFEDGLTIDMIKTAINRNKAGHPISSDFLMKLDELLIDYSSD